MRIYSMVVTVRADFTEVTVGVESTLQVELRFTWMASAADPSKPKSKASTGARKVVGMTMDSGDFRYDMLG